MAISHVCLECGLDLARIRAQRDPEYDLWIVRCPRCATCGARNPNQIRRTWHSILRVDIALSILLVQVLVAVVAASINVFAINVGTRLLSYQFIEHLWQRAHVPVLAYVLISSICTGAWLTAAFGHVRTWKLWLGWSVVLALLLGFFGQPERLIGMELSAAHQGEPILDWIMRCINVLAVIVLLVAIYMIAALPGIAVGRMLRAGHGTFRRLRWRMRRRRRRRWIVRV